MILLFKSRLLLLLKEILQITHELCIALFAVAEGRLLLDFG